MELKGLAQVAKRFAYVGTQDYIENNPRAASRLALVSFATFQASAILYTISAVWLLSRGRKRRPRIQATHDDI